MTTVSSTQATYWGEGGEYGPFIVQTYGEWAGWPDFGQVQRYFRVKAKLSPQEFAAIYGRETKPDGSPISLRQVLRMELENEVPMDMNRRKLIARLLNIPSMLFGLATLEQVTLRPHPEVAGASLATGYTALPRVVADTAKYQSNIRTLLTLHHTSQAQSEFIKITADIQDLVSLESQARGDLQYHIRELLFSYYLLAAKVVRDQRDFSLSYHYANQAVRVAKATGDPDLIATAFYTRGATYLEWGRNGTLVQGVFHVQIDKISNATRDFEQAKVAAEHTEKSLHPQIVGLINISLSRAYAIHALNMDEKVPTLAMTLLDEAEEKAGQQSIDDPYERHLVTGSLTGFVKGEYYNGKARNLTIAGRPAAALKELATLESLRQGAIGKHLTRNQIWLDIVAADVFMGLEQFEEATKRAKNALLAARDINSVAKFACIVDIHGRLLQSTYKAEPDVEELGDIIHETIQIQ